MEHGSFYERQEAESFLGSRLFVYFAVLKKSIFDETNTN